MLIVFILLCSFVLCFLCCSKKSSVILLPLLKKKKDEDENYPYDVHTFKKTDNNLSLKHDISKDDFEL